MALIGVLAAKSSPYDLAVTMSRHRLDPDRHFCFFFGAGVLSAMVEPYVSASSGLQAWKM